MDGKQEMIRNLREEKKRWEDLLAGLSEAQILAKELPGGWSIKDVMAHLMAWQQRTNARLDAARHNRKPDYPAWPENLEIETEGEPNDLNAWIYATYREQPWPAVYRQWQQGFQQVLDSAEAIPEKDMMEKGRYPWLEDYRLIDVLIGTYEHHHLEHYDPLMAWLKERGWV